MSRRSMAAGMAAFAMMASAPRAARSADEFYYSAGVNIGVLSDTEIVIEPFSFWVWHGVAAGFGGEIVNFTSEVIVNLTRVGLNGRDRGSPGVPPDGAYKLWGCHNPTTGEVGFVATLTLDVREIVFPPGFTSNRKIMYGQPVIGGRCLPMHAANWPMPTLTFTDRLVVATLTSNTGGWVPINLSKFIPENARLGYFHAELSAPANIWISPLGTTGQTFWKTLAKGQAGIGPVMPCRVNGDQVVYVWLDAGVTALLVLDGFAMTEVS